LNANPNDFQRKLVYESIYCFLSASELFPLFLKKRSRAIAGHMQRYEKL
jgi:hypothetical protein